MFTYQESLTNSQQEELHRILLDYAYEFRNKLEDVINNRVDLEEGEYLRNFTDVTIQDIMEVLNIP